MKKLTKEEFIQKVKEIHGDKYDFTDTVYTVANAYVTFRCPIHGEVEVYASSLLRGRGCPRCGKELGYEKTRNSLDVFIERARAVHGDKYDYSKVVYVGGRYKVTIICPEHGEFELRPFLHWKGRGCQKCARKRCGRKKKIDTPS